MRSFWFVCLVAACAGVDPDTTELQAAIVNGTVDTGDVAVVALTYQGLAFCTGTLVAPRVVVTAAHCVDRGLTGRSVAGIDVFFGWDVRSGGTHVRVVDGQTHPRWNRQTLEWDIALLALEAVAPVEPVPLNRNSLDPSFIGRTTRLVGFGTTTAASLELGTKRETTSSVTRIDAESLYYGGTSGQTCHGDSGGPVFLTLDGRELVAGVTSWGDLDCGEFGASHRIDVHAVDFIDPFIARWKGSVEGNGGMSASYGCAVSRSHRSPSGAVGGILFLFAGFGYRRGRAMCRCMIGLIGLVAVLLTHAADAAPDAGPPKQLTVKVGSSVQLRLGFLPIQTVCDDTSIIRVDAASDPIQIVGLKEGKTRCGFWQSKFFPPWLVEIVVIPADAKRPKPQCTPDP